MKRHFLWWVPNVLTVFRCFLAVIVSWSLFEYTFNYMPIGEPSPSTADAQFVSPGHPLMVLAFLGFLAAALTDWLDGVLARDWNAVTRFGRLLDPIADKMLVIGCLLPIMFAFIRQNGFTPALIAVVPALAIIVRDLAVTGLRFSKWGGASTQVSRLAKLKTALELGVIGLILLGGAFQWALPPQILPWVILILLWLAAGLSVYTGWSYVRSAFRPR